MFKVCLAGTSEPIEGTTSFETLEEAKLFLLDIQVYYSDDDPEKPITDSSKYVILPYDMA